jgi:hypothetical protein
MKGRSGYRTPTVGHPFVERFRSSARKVKRHPQLNPLE